MFASMTAAYEGLSERMQVYLAGMTALRTWRLRGSQAQLTQRRREVIRTIIMVVHTPE